jgi:hypothetical protein
MQQFDRACSDGNLNDCPQCAAVFPPPFKTLKTLAYIVKISLRDLRIPSFHFTVYSIQFTVTVIAKFTYAIQGMAVQKLVA